MDSLYELLRVHPDADRDDIKRAFYRLAKEYHPDISKNSALFIKILNAYKTLTDDYKRDLYDKAFASQAGKEQARNAQGRALHACKQQASNAKAREQRARDPVVLPNDRLVYAVSLSDVARNPHYRTVGGRRRKQFVPPEFDICVNLTEGEQKTGAVINVAVPAHVICPLCGGHHGTCRLCSDRGYVLRAVPVPVPIPVHCEDGEVFSVPLSRKRGNRFAYFMISELKVKVKLFQR